MSALIERNEMTDSTQEQSEPMQETVESLTAYYKQWYDEGEYSVGDLCVMLARAEVGCSALEALLARAEGVIAKVEAYLDGPMPEGMSYMTSFTRRAFIDGVDASRSVVRAILSKANKEAS